MNRSDYQFSQQLNLEHEYLLWMYHIKVFVDFYRQTQSKIIFRGGDAYLGGPRKRGLDDAIQKVDSFRRESAHKFLEWNDQPNFRYDCYNELIHNEEYQRLQQENRQLYFFTKLQFEGIQSELENRGLHFSPTLNLPKQYVLLFAPASKIQLLEDKVKTLIGLIEMRIRQNITPFLAPGVSLANQHARMLQRFNQFRLLEIDQAQALQLKIIYDLRRFEETYRVSLNFIAQQHHLQLQIFGKTLEDANSAAQTIDTWLKNKSLHKLSVQPQHLPDVYKAVLAKLSIQYMNLIIIQQSQIYQAANMLDQQFQLNLMQFATTYFANGCVIFYRRSECRSVEYSFNEIMSQMLQTDQPKNFQKSGVKNYRVDSMNDWEFTVSFFNLTTQAARELVINDLDMHLLREKFAEYKELEIRVPCKIEAMHSMKREFLFRVQLGDHQARQFQGESQENKDLVIKHLVEFMNSSIFRIIEIGVELSEECEKLAKQFDCNFKQLKTSNAMPGWYDNSENITDDPDGKMAVLYFSNLIKSQVPKLISQIDSLLKAKLNPQSGVPAKTKVYALCNNLISLLSQLQVDYKAIDQIQNSPRLISWVSISCPNHKDFQRKLEEAAMKELSEIVARMSEELVVVESSQKELIDRYAIQHRDQYQDYFEQWYKQQIYESYDPNEDYKCNSYKHEEQALQINISKLDLEPQQCSLILSEIQEFASSNEYQLEPCKLFVQIQDLVPGMYFLGFIRMPRGQEFVLRKSDRFLIEQS